MNKCNECGKDTKNPKFCTKSCAAKCNGRLFPKRKSATCCTHPGCFNPLKRWCKSYKLCAIHHSELMDKKALERSSKTLLTLQTRASVLHKHPSWKNAHVRHHARTLHKDLLKLPCAHCGYTKHVELCHIKSVTSFPLESTLLEVNSRENVIQLCPNCHWEFDHSPRQ